MRRGLAGATAVAMSVLTATGAGGTSGAAAAATPVPGTLLVQSSQAGVITSAPFSLVDEAAGDSITLTASTSGTMQFSGRRTGTTGSSSVTTVSLTPPAGQTLTSGTRWDVGGTRDAAHGLAQVNATGVMCSGTKTGEVDVARADLQGGTLTRLAATYRLACGQTEIWGAVHYRDDGTYRAVQVQPTANAGPVIVGRQRTTTATITNRGNVPVTFDGTHTVSGLSAALHTVADDRCGTRTLPPTESCEVDVTFSPDQKIVAGAFVRLGADTATGDVAVPANGTGVDQPPAPTNLSGRPAYDGVGLSWLAPSGGTAQRYHVYRSIDGAAEVEVAAPTDTSYADTDLARGQSATYTVTAETAAGEGLHSAPVTAARLDADPPATGSHRVLTASHGDVPPGLTVDAYSAVATDPTVDGGFTIAGGGLSLRVRTPASTLAPGDYVTSQGDFSGPSLSLQGFAQLCDDGTQPGSLHVDELVRKADGTPAVFTGAYELHCSSGTHTVRGVVRWDSTAGYPAATITPGRVDDGEVRVGDQAPIATVTLANAGTEPLTLGTSELIGTDASEWEILGHTCPATLPVDGSCTVDVQFEPTSRGAKTAALRIADGTYGGLDAPAGGVSLVALTGEGVTEPGAPPLAVSTQLTTVQLDATGPVDDGGSRLTTYKFYAGPDPDHLTEVAADALGHATLDGIEPGTDVYVAASAVNAFGEGPRTAPVRVHVASRQLAFSRYTDAAPGYALTLRDLDGGADGASPETRLTDPLYDDADSPAFSPDGRRLVYGTSHLAFSDHYYWTDYDLVIRPLATSGAGLRLTDTPDRDETDPAWSPNGKTIAFTQWSATGDPSVWTVPATGGTPTRLPYPGDLAQPSWTPDGRHLVVTESTTPSTPRLRVLAVDGSSNTVLPGGDGGFEPAVSPDGRTVAFAHLDSIGSSSATSSLWRVPLTGGTPTALSTMSGYLSGPAWSPDGAAVVFDRTSPFSGTFADIWSVPADGGPATDLTVSSGVDEMQPDVNAIDRSGPTVALAGSAWVGPRPTIAFALADATTRVGSLTATCRVDGRAALSCTSPWRPGPLVGGPHTVTVTASDPAGNTGTATATFTVDATAPTATLTAPATSFVLGAASVAWRGTDRGSGVRSHDVRYRTGDATHPLGGWVYPASWHGLTKRSLTTTLKRGVERCFAVRARDRVGNASAWSAPRCTARPYDDRWLHGSGWRRGQGQEAYAGTWSRSYTRGAGLSGFGAGARVAIVARTCPACGSVSVGLGGRLLGNVSLRSATTRHQRVLVLPAQSRLRSGMLRIHVTSSGKPVWIDGVGLRRT